MDGPMSAEAIETSAFAESGMLLSRLRTGAVALSAVILAVSAWHMFTGGTHPDVSWLILVGNRMLDGERLYVDVLENNPPFSIYLYLPMVWLGRVTPVSAESWTVLGTYVWAIAFGAFALRMTRRLGLATAAERLAITPVGLYLLLLLAPTTFSQREHFAVAAALPMLVIAAWRMKGEVRPVLPPAWMIVAGAGAAVTMMVKPHYALLFLLPYLLAAWTARSPRLLFGPEILTAAFAVIAYGMWVWVAYPEYISAVLPALLDIYGDRHDLYTLLFTASLSELLLFGLLVVMLTGVSRRVNPLAWTFAAAAAAAYCVFLYLGKGWVYHLLPALTFTLLAIALIGARRWLGEEAASGGGRNRIVFAGIVAATSMAVAGTLVTWQRYDPPQWLADRINAIAPHPAVASVSDEIGIGHPWARSLRGVWVGRDCADWIVAGGVKAKIADPDMSDERRAHLDAIIEEAVERKISEWKAMPPDVVMLDSAPSGWTSPILEDPEFATLLSNYRVVFRYKRASLALRSDLLPAWQAASATASSPGAASD
ncbi:hypothetical protein [Oricola nitratireducens]|uniref:hypothetical protein n=1 Tax=Oricola nitratireducens TaxID=2775868 RepID=UPI0018696827|nr:hypothetical protein [Oricola nitratireducens]